MAAELQSPLDSDFGRTTISDSVVSTIAGMALRSVKGIHSVGGKRQAGLSKVRDALPGVSSADPGSGIGVEVGEAQTAIDMALTVDYGVPIVRLAEQVREAVISAVEELTGLQVTEVNIAVEDVFLEDPEQQ